MTTLSGRVTTPLLIAPSRFVTVDAFAGAGFAGALGGGGGAVDISFAFQFGVFIFQLNKSFR